VPKPKIHISPNQRSKVSQFEKDRVGVVETNVDDVTGEIIGVTLEKLIQQGAYDATATPFLGKKGRPGITVRVVCEPNSVEKYAKLLVEETGTFGVKTYESTRLIVPRKVIFVHVNIGSYSGQVNTKVSLFGKNPKFKPEMSEAKKISESEGIPLRRVIELITIAAENQLNHR